MMKFGGILMRQDFFSDKSYRAVQRTDIIGGKTEI